MQFNKAFIKAVVPGVNFLGAEMPDNAPFAIDSRTVMPGELFCALKGGRCDGHDFVKEAVARGAVGLMIAQGREACLESLDKKQRAKIAVIVVPDVLAALLTMATAWRSQFTIPVIGVTGSVGKTSTKEMLGRLMECAGKNYLMSQGNQNTAIGAALNILRMRPEHEVAIFELGVSKRGEMARMAEMVRPTTAIITTIGHSHMEGLGSINDIANEKRDIFKYFKEDSIGIINGDQPLLASISYTHPIIKFGCKMTNQIQARKIQVRGSQTHCVLKMYKERYRITMPTNHLGLVLNGLAVAAVGRLLNIAPALIVESLQKGSLVPSRFEQRVLKQKRGVLIDDCYNASPESMKAALLAFEKLDAQGQKIAVLGDMLELGVNAPFWHRQLGRFLRKVPSLQHVVFVGDTIKWAQKTMPAYLTCDIVPTWKDAVSCLQEKLQKESVVLVKGSNGVGLQNLVREITESA